MTIYSPDTPIRVASAGGWRLLPYGDGSLERRSVRHIATINWSCAEVIEKIVTYLKMHTYFRGLSDEILVEVAKHVEVVEYDTGACVQAANEPVTSIGFLVRGRLKAVIVDQVGNQRLFRFFKKGEAIGMLAAMSEPVPVSFFALEPTTVLRIDYQVAFDLTSRHQDLRRRWSEKLAGKLREFMLGDSREPTSKTIVMLHESPGTRYFAKQLLLRLHDLGEKLCLFGDNTDHPPHEDILFRSLFNGDRRLDEMEIRRQIGQWPQHDRVVFDVDVTADPDWALRLIELSDHVLWCVRPERYDATLEQLKVFASKMPGSRDKTSVVWLLDDIQLSPLAADLHDFAHRAFKISAAEVQYPLGIAVTCGLERLVHYLRGVQVGLALGGGAARGMAHLGVLKALERNDIVIDMIAGTSAGAMTGIVYAAGLDADYCAERFVEDLRPSWFFRSLPHGEYWYLMHKYRRGKFRPMLRRYLSDWKLEQLPIPCLGVTVDLVSGQAVVRETGDAVEAILESINLPVLSRPICRTGQALIDGGVLNNVPADVLASKGCNFVIAVDVIAHIEEEFAANRPDTPAEKMRTPSILQTVLRTYAVQSHYMNAARVAPADITIEPDLSSIDLAAFTRATEAAAVGEKETLKKIPQVKTLLKQLDKRLFAFDE